jgi:hypothetical protein
MYMKKMLSTLIVAAMMFVASAAAIDLNCQWKANPTNEMVTSYVVEMAKDTPNFTNFIPVVTVTTTNATVRGVTTSCALRVVAKNIQGTSGPSNVDKYPKVAPTVPVQFIITNP